VFFKNLIFFNIFRYVKNNFKKNYLNIKNNHYSKTPHNFIPKHGFTLKFRPSDTHKTQKKKQKQKNTLNFDSVFHGGVNNLLGLSKLYASTIA
jgi:hypothetical protein